MSDDVYPGAERTTRGFNPATGKTCRCPYPHHAANACATPSLGPAREPAPTLEQRALEQMRAEFIEGIDRLERLLRATLTEICTQTSVPSPTTEAVAAKLAQEPNHE